MIETSNDHAKQDIIDGYKKDIKGKNIEHENKWS